MANVEQIKLSRIEAGTNEQRMDMDLEDLAGLAKSIKRLGVLVPVVVVKRGDNYELVAGHRRLAAAYIAKLETIPAIIREASEATKKEITFAENYFRQDLSPVELACAIGDILDKQAMGVEEIAEGFGKKPHWVKKMAAIRDWPPDVLQGMHGGGLSIGAAANLAVIPDDNYRQFLVTQAVESGATARATAAWLQAYRALEPAEAAVQAEPVPGQPAQQPMAPKAPCLGCSEIFPVNEMSHVPMCGGCIKAIREAVGS